jgi:type IV secretion system protein VirB4
VVDALDSPIGTTIREQCKTIVGFPIERPDRKDLKRLRYTDRECEIIESLRPGTGQHLIRQGDRSVVAQLALGGMPDIMAVLSGNEQNIQILDAIRERVGDDNPVALIEEFQKCHV